MNKKELIIFLVILLVVCSVVGGIILKNNIDKKNEEARIAEIKEGWYVEISNEYLNVREKANAQSRILGKVHKGEVYKVLDFEIGENFFWYKIEFKKDKKNYAEGYIANPRNSTDEYLIDVNNPQDIYKPTLKFEKDEYYTYSIDTINYKHLTISDDKGVASVTHQVYHEVNQAENIDQYWIKYTVTDESGKTTSKTQKIIFDVNPSEDKVLEFYSNY